MITKKQLGLMIAGSGALIVIGTLAVEILGAGRESGLGPAQQLALAGALGLIAFGLTLVPLGDRPA
jgi:hypothetical protein